jgi:two-component system aerobic respiration control sensor histidine kinase ArcB
MVNSMHLMHQNIIGENTMVSKKKQDKRSLLEAAFSNLHYMIDLVPANVYWKDINFRYQGSNAMMANIAGIPSKNFFIGKNDFDIAKVFNWPDELPNSLRKDDGFVVKTESPKLNIEEPLISFPNGKYLYQLTNKVPIFNEKNAVIGILGISVDITKIKKLQEALITAKEKAEEFNALKSEFMQNMQHDIRTPAGGIQQLFDYIRNRASNEDLKEVAEMGLGASEELSNLLDDIVNFDRTQYRHAVIEKPFDIKELFGSIYRINRPVALNKQLNFRYVIDPHLPDTLLSDDYRIKHILLNLVGNALKFTAQGEVVFTAKLVNQSDRKLLVELSVKDTGMGIASDKVDAIFEKFVRLEPSNKGIYKGTGLGLANVREYVQQLGGEIKPVESFLNRGTTFSVLIPMKSSLTAQFPTQVRKTSEQTINLQDAVHQAKQTPTPKKANRQSDKHLCTKQGIQALLVEDSLIAQRMSVSLLQNVGIQVETADSAEEALEKFKNKKYDIVFADIGLSQINGIEMTKKMRQLEKEEGREKTLIAAQTAQPNADNTQACFEAGMQAVLGKPLTRQSVSSLLVDHLPRVVQEADNHVDITLQQTKVIDFNRLKQIMPSDADQDQIFNTILEHWDAIVTEIQGAYQAKDWKQLAHHVFKHKGSFSYLADMRLDEAMGMLYNYLTSHDQLDEKTISALYQLVQQEMTALKKVVTRKTQEKKRIQS